jgi:large subunit ribosomal protein L25
MKKVVLKAVKRTVTGKQVSVLRRQGQLPAIIYGRHMEPLSITLNAHDAGLIIPKLTSSSIVTIDLEGHEHLALVREKQKNYIKGTLTHVDFQAVTLAEKIRAYVPIHISGTALALKNFNSTLVNNMTRVEVEALPLNLPERIDVDVTSLDKIGSAIHVSDLQIPADVTLMENLNAIIVVVTAVKEEVVEVAAVVPGAEAAAAEPEVIEKGKKEEEEAEEKK